jgi:hypothetical protein
MKSIRRQTIYNQHSKKKELDSSFVWAVFPTFRPPQNNNVISGTVQDYNEGSASLEAGVLTPWNIPCEGVTATPNSFGFAQVTFLKVVKDGAELGELNQGGMDLNDPAATSKKLTHIYIFILTKMCE